MACSSTYFFRQCSAISGKSFSDIFDYDIESVNINYVSILHIIDDNIAGRVFNSLNKLLHGNVFTGFHTLGFVDSANDQKLKMLPCVRIYNARGTAHYMYSMHWCYDVHTFAKDFKFSPKIKIYGQPPKHKKPAFELDHLCDDTLVSDTLFKHILKDSLKGRYLKSFYSDESRSVSFTELSNQMINELPS